MNNVTVTTIVEGLQVWVDGKPLSIEESRLLRNHSESFSWGYMGSGPSQTALAICLYLFGPYIAPQVYMQFKNKYVASWIRWDDAEHQVNIERFYMDYIEGVTLDHAKVRFSNNVHARLLAAAEDNEDAVSLIHESTVAITGNEVRIVTERHSQVIGAVCESLNLSYANFDGKWSVIASMPMTGYLKQLLATAKNYLQV